MPHIPEIRDMAEGLTLWLDKLRQPGLGDADDPVEGAHAKATGQAGGKRRSEAKAELEDDARE